MTEEKQELDGQIVKMKEEIESLNEYISGMNTEMVRSRIKEKEKEMEMNSVEDEKEEAENKNREQE